MGFWGKITDIARQTANQSFRDIASSKAAQVTSPPTLAKVIAVNDDQYTVILASGETMLVYPGGSRAIALGQTYHLIGDTIF